MKTVEAKEILLLYRPGTCEAEDPQMKEALALAERDPELAKWFEQHQAFQRAMRAKFKQIPVSERQKLALLARRKTVKIPRAWQHPVWLAAAAIFLVLLGLAGFWFRPTVPDHFVNYRERMVSAAVRMYGMDLVTNDMGQLRQFIGHSGAPADYDLTQGLARLQVKGGGLLRWRGNPVSMVCFDPGGGGTLFLFVMKRSGVKDPPPVAPAAEVAEVNGLSTASWSDPHDVYVLAGPSEPDFAGKYVR